MALVPRGHQPQQENLTTGQRSDWGRLIGLCVDVFGSKGDDLDIADDHLDSRRRSHAADAPAGTSTV